MMFTAIGDYHVNMANVTHVTKSARMSDSEEFHSGDWHKTNPGDMATILWFNFAEYVAFDNQMYQSSLAIADGGDYYDSLSTDDNPTD